MNFISPSNWHFLSWKKVMNNFANFRVIIVNFRGENSVYDNVKFVILLAVTFHLHSQARASLPFRYKIQRTCEEFFSKLAGSDKELVRPSLPRFHKALTFSSHNSDVSFPWQLTLGKVFLIFSDTNLRKNAKIQMKKNEGTPSCLVNVCFSRRCHKCDHYAFGLTRY